jgi:HAD superfamily hydrolase (TIGR01450 family)
MKRRRNATNYLIDVEGVLVRDKRYVPVPGSVDWFNGLPGRGIKACLVSNNTTHRPQELIADLQRAGFAVEPRQLVSALDAGSELLRRWGNLMIMWLGASRLNQYWRDHGFELVESGACQAVVLGLNPELRLEDLDRALPALVDESAYLVALHRNVFFLDEQGERRFGPGAWCAALETAAASRPAICVGKPSERIYREALKRIGASPEDALFISDDPVSDLVTAKKLGLQTVMVLSGKYSDHAVLARLDQEDWPDIICERPADLAL